jgi:hypothetical protein
MSERRRERLVLRAYVYSEIFNGFHKPEERKEITGAQIQMMVDKGEDRVRRGEICLWLQFFYNTRSSLRRGM